VKTKVVQASATLDYKPSQPLTMETTPFSGTRYKQTIIKDGSVKVLSVISQEGEHIVGLLTAMVNALNATITGGNHVSDNQADE
jgi:hypothetical protein